MLEDSRTDIELIACEILRSIAIDVLCLIDQRIEGLVDEMERQLHKRQLDLPLHPADEDSETSANMRAF